MAEFELAHPTRAAAAPAAPAFPQRLMRNYLDWEDWLTLAVMLGAVFAVTVTLENGGWSRQMPPITLVGFIAALSALSLARSSLPALAALPLALALGALVVAWRTLEMAGPGSIATRIDNVSWRFDRWADIAQHGGVSNDPLPFNVLVMGLTWLGVFLAGWSVFRWSNAWIGLLPGAITLFLDAALVGDPLSFAVVCYILFGLLLVMRTALVSSIRRWRREDASYPPLISLTFLNFGLWTLLALIAAAWVAPTGPFATPAPVQALADRLTSAGVHFVRLAGPLETKKIIPVHDYTGVLPIQGSVDMGDRQVLALQPDDLLLRGPFALRGAVYDIYTSGGWEAGARTDITLSQDLFLHVTEAISKGEAKGEIISLKIAVTARSIVGSVLFGLGDPIAADRPLRAEAPDSSLAVLPLPPGTDSAEAMAEAVAAGLMPVEIDLDSDGRPVTVRAFNPAEQVAPDSVVLRPTHHIEEGQSYRVIGFVSTATPDDLRNASRSYPDWVTKRYLQLPDTLPQRVFALAYWLTVNRFTPYDMAVSIRDFLRTRPVDYRYGDVPPGADTVDHFLFKMQRGYFDYHASAMVVLLRAVGVPARLAVGYVVDESDLDTDRTYAVRDSDSYAWAEVYFPGYGWIPFNPSPDRPADLRPTRQTPESPQPAPLSEAPAAEPVGADSIFDTLPQAGQRAPTAVTSVEGRGPSYALWTALALVTFASALAAAFVIGWRRSVAGLPYPQQLWEKTVRLAAWAGYPPQPGQTPADYARRLEKAFRGTPGISLLADAYNCSRFGRREVDAEERDRLERMWPHLRGALLGAIVLRPWRRRRRRYDPMGGQDGTGGTGISAT